MEQDTGQRAGGSLAYGEGLLDRVLRGGDREDKDSVAHLTSWHTPRSQPAGEGVHVDERGDEQGR